MLPDGAHGPASGRGVRDRTVVVTGAAGGVGRAIAERLLERGANVVAADIAEVDADWTARQPSERLLTARVDIADPTSTAQLAAISEARFGPVFGLVNNAAIDAPPGLAWDISVEHWREVVDVNLSGAWWCTRAFLDGMRARGEGRVVFISSIAARVGADRYSPAYAAAKAGILGLTVGLATQLESSGILCNAITPGATGTTGTPMTAEERARLEREFPLGAGGTTPIVDAVTYLLDASGSWISGAVLNVSGGQLRGI